MNNKEILEKRLNKIVNTIESIETFINELDFNIPDAAKKAIIKTINSDEIKEIVNGIKEKRPPRLAFIGRSGVGKSSLINAIMGSYLAETSAVDIGTINASPYQYKRDGEVIFEIIDTRGFKENLQASDNTAEEDLENAIKDFEPDAFLMLNNGSDRSTLKEDAEFLKELTEQLEIHVPLITIITRVDELDPARIKEPHEYTQRKKNFIKEKEEQVKSVLEEVGISNSFVLPVSSYIEWSHEEPESLITEEQEKLTIKFDGRYNIDKLIEFLEENIDFRAAVYMMLNSKLEDAMKKIANRFVKVFSTVSAGVALTPIPASDIVILIPIQILEVTLIAYLNGVQLNAKAAREFIMSLGGIALFGLGLRLVAQQGSKFLNLVIPGSGSTVSSAVAYSGTHAVGKAAIAYYIEGKSQEESKIIMQENIN